MIYYFVKYSKDGWYVGWFLVATRTLYTQHCSFYKTKHQTKPMFSISLENNYTRSNSLFCYFRGCFFLPLTAHPCSQIKYVILNYECRADASLVGVHLQTNLHVSAPPSSFLLDCRQTLIHS